MAALSHAFFHDVLNTAGCVRGYADLLAEEIQDDHDAKENMQRLNALANQLIEQIECHRDLIYAEGGDLAPQWQVVQTNDFLDMWLAAFACHRTAQARTIRQVDVWRGTIVTDTRLLARVLANMLKNAVEATPPGQTVTVRCVEEGDRVRFSVHNPGCMPNEVQLQIFHRSFSTKGEKGRGIGTHSMKLLGERYLGGEVGFTSTETDGTTFLHPAPEGTADRRSGRPRQRDKVSAGTVCGGADIPVCHCGRDFVGRQECLPHCDEKRGTVPNHWAGSFVSTTPDNPRRSFRPLPASQGLAPSRPLR